MRRLAWHSSFTRAYKRRTRNSPGLQGHILEAISRLAQDPFDPILKTHKLHGKLAGLWACWVSYDCRVIFGFEPDPLVPNEELIALIDLGTHDEVY